MEKQESVCFWSCWTVAEEPANTESEKLQPEKQTFVLPILFLRKTPKEKLAPRTTWKQFKKSQKGLDVVFDDDTKLEKRQFYLVDT